MNRKMGMRQYQPVWSAQYWVLCHYKYEGNQAFSRCSYFQIGVGGRKNESHGMATIRVPEQFSSIP